MGTCDTFRDHFVFPDQDILCQAKVCYGKKLLIQDDPMLMHTFLAFLTFISIKINLKTRRPTFSFSRYITYNSECIPHPPFVSVQYRLYFPQPTWYTQVYILWNIHSELRVSRKSNGQTCIFGLYGIVYTKRWQKTLKCPIFTSSWWVAANEKIYFNPSPFEAISPLRFLFLSFFGNFIR